MDMIARGNAFCMQAVAEEVGLIKEPVSWTLLLSYMPRKLARKKQFLLFRLSSA